MYLFYKGEALNSFYNAQLGIKTLLSAFYTSKIIEYYKYIETIKKNSQRRKLKKHTRLKMDIKRLF